MRVWIRDPFFWVVVTASLILILMLTWPTKGECGEYDCSGFICVVHADCPETCFCAKEPWAPQGECS